MTEYARQKRDGSVVAAHEAESGPQDAFIDNRWVSTHHGFVDEIGRTLMIASLMAHEASELLVALGEPRGGLRDLVDLLSLNGPGGDHPEVDQLAEHAELALSLTDELVGDIRAGELWRVRDADEISIPFGGQRLRDARVLFNSVARRCQEFQQQPFFTELHSVLRR